MPSKNDLSWVALKSANTLPKNSLSAVQAPVIQKAGRKPKPVSQKESEILSMKLTMGEMDALKEKAGMVPLATFVKHHLRKKTDLLK